MKTHISQTSFVAGTLDETARARHETALYRNGAAALINCLPLVTGGVISRWGTRHLGTLPEIPVLEEFAFSLEQSYLAVFLGGEVRFFFASDGAPAGALTGCPWTSAQLRGLRFAQGGDLMWVVHPDMRPHIIRRVGASSWSLEQLTFDGARGTPLFRYAPNNITATWNAAGGVLNFSGAWLQSGHAGTAIRVWDANASVYRYGTIGTVNSGTQCTVTWDGSAPPDGVATTLWEEAAFSLVRGWPRSVCLHQQRLVFGGSRDAGDAIWMSRVGQWWNFDLGTAADGDAIAMALGATRVRTIQHSVSGPQLTFFSEAGVFFVPEQETRPITPTTARIRHVAPFGTGDVRPGAFDGGVLFVQGRGRAVRDLAYTAEADNLTAEPVSLPATDVIGEIVDAAYLSGAQDRPEQYAFFVNSAGKIALFHSVRVEKIGAWCEWTTQGAFRAVGVAGGRVFVAVERAGTVRLEQFDAALAFDATIEDVTPDLAAPHLVGFEVHGRIGDDYLGGAEAGAGGALILPRQRPELGGVEDGQTVELGLAFDWWIDPLPPVIDLPDGTLQQRTQRVLETHLRLYRARSARVGGQALTLLNDGFTPGAPPAAWDGWWMTRHLGFARPNEGAQLTRRIDREVPMPVGVLALKRVVVVPV
jgi:hypothetical protein